MVDNTALLTFSLFSMPLVVVVVVVVAVVVVVVAVAVVLASEASAAVSACFSRRLLSVDDNVS